MNPDDSTLIQHIIDAASEACSFCKNTTLDDFLSNRMISNATIRSFEVMGEAASKLSQTFKEQHSEIEWRDITAMRNMLIHAYFDVNNEIVWQTVQEDIKPLIAQLQHILDTL